MKEINTLSLPNDENMITFMSSSTSISKHEMQAEMFIVKADKLSIGRFT